MKKKILFLIVFIFVILLNLNSDAPAWILNPKMVYPEKDYFSSVGEGRNKEEAENNAIGGISKIFETNVNVNNTFNERTTMKDNQTSRIINMSVNVQLKSNMKLINVNTGESWNGNGKYYVIAYLNKRETAKLYQNKISSNDAKIETLIKNMDSDYSKPFDKCYYGSQAVILADENDKFYGNLILLVSPEVPPQPKYTYSSTNIAVGQLMKKISMKIVIDKKYRNVEQKISKVLTGLGFSVSKNGSVNVVTEVNETSPRTDDSGFIFVNYSLNIDIDDGDETFFTFTKSNKKVGDTNIDRLSVKLIGELEKYIDTEFEKELIVSFNESLKKRAKANS